MTTSASSDPRATAPTRYGTVIRLPSFVVTLTCAIALTCFGGCASMQDCRYEMSQRFRGLMEFQRRPSPRQSDYPSDYRAGWLDGFNEVTTGGPNCPPAIAPKRYWNPKQVLKDCDRRRAAYYEGWHDGAARAAQLPDTHHLKVYESDCCPMPRCSCGSSLCTGGCAIDAGSSMLISEQMIESAPTVSPSAPVGSTVIESFDASSTTIQDVPVMDMSPTNPPAHP
ncbi:hypothetical protein [Crateriforma conspicua]|uniref:hypothetical protein n=1 Tax=Crateriforma conspicua TaxID=2527996 RepID=UPI0011A5C883|nr:hypothetical protein [Crateriforma conspicua]